MNLMSTVQPRYHIVTFFFFFYLRNTHTHIYGGRGDEISHCYLVKQNYTLLNKIKKHNYCPVVREKLTPIKIKFKT